MQIEARDSLTLIWPSRGNSCDWSSEEICMKTDAPRPVHELWKIPLKFSKRYVSSTRLIQHSKDPDWLKPRCDDARKKGKIRKR